MSKAHKPRTVEGEAILHLAARPESEERGRSSTPLSDLRSALTAAEEAMAEVRRCAMVVAELYLEARS